MYRDPHDSHRHRDDPEPRYPPLAYRVYRHDPAGDVFVNRNRPLYSEMAAKALALAEHRRTGRRTSVAKVATESFSRLTASQSIVWMSQLNAPRGD